MYMLQTAPPELSGTRVELTPKAWRSISADAIRAAQEAIDDIRRKRLCEKARRCLCAIVGTEPPHPPVFEQPVIVSNVLIANPALSENLTEAPTLLGSVKGRFETCE